jgi:DNA-3-methyladenine glycosylase II
MGSKPAAVRSFTIEVAAPFRLDLTVWALRRRPHNLIDRFDGRCYRRTLVLSGQPVEVTVRQQDGHGAPLLLVGLQGSGTELSGDCAVPARQVLKRTLGLEARPARLLPARRAGHAAPGARP